MELIQPLGQASQGIMLSVIVPTFNERENVRELIDRLNSCLDHINWEVIFVDDDSPDGTAELVYQIGRYDPRVRCIKRIGRRGLSSACIEGMLSSSAPFLAKIDGDLQHDETLLPQMLKIIHDDDLDIVIGSRYVSGGGIGDWDPKRAAVSRFAKWAAKITLRTELTDPTSGFFLIRREAFYESLQKLTGIGFEILIDIFVSSPRPLQFKELPYEFQSRRFGKSKLDSQVAWDYLMLLLDKLVGYLIPIRFMAFTLVGGVGVFVHLLVLFLLFKLLNTGFVLSQSIATLIAMTSNFSLNNILTYHDLRLRGWYWLRGWMTFVLVCGIGAIANVGVASYLFAKENFWLISAFAGIIVGAVWNYAVTSVYTWKKS